MYRIASFSELQESFWRVLKITSNSFILASSFWSNIFFAPLSRIFFAASSSNSVSRSKNTSLRSIDTIILSSAALDTFTSSARLNISRISLSLSNPIARSNVVTGNFFLRSIYAYMTLLMSVANSIHEPLKGITRAEYSCVPFACTDEPKNTPGERCNWETTTRSAPLMINVPLFVIYGIWPKYTSWTWVEKSSWSGSVQYNFNLALR